LTGTSKPGGVSGEPPPRDERPRPKRGAFPTRKADIEAATPFAPDVSDADDVTGAKHDRANDVDDQEHTD
jgi:hypothetical protein